MFLFETSGLGVQHERTYEISNRPRPTDSHPLAPLRTCLSTDMRASNVWGDHSVPWGQLDEPARRVGGPLLEVKQRRAAPSEISAAPGRT